MSLTGILVPLPAELQTLTNKRLQPGGVLALDANTLVCLSGIGYEAAVTATRNLLDHGADHLLNWGCCGGLDPNIEAGALILPARITCETTARSYECCPPWRSNLMDALQMRAKANDHVLLHCAKEVISHAAHKKALHQANFASVVDMESGGMAYVAETAGIPFMVIRAVADRASEGIPSSVTHAMNAQGQVQILTLIRELITKPEQIRALLNLGHNFRQASSTLRSTKQQLIQHNWCRPEIH